ncbi:NAD-dependent epimerase/dehydratase family protein [Alphaproteobacteria bacterium]|nr:NAD-dependent epimerase/dehydratase family protein [Alphaproteobacteria bacterium]
MTFYIEKDIENITKNLDDDFKNNLAGKTVLVIGSEGFLGKYFIKSLINFNDNNKNQLVNIIGLDNLRTSKKDNNDVTKYEFIEHDVTSPLSLSQKPEFIIFAAGIASPYYYRKYPLETLDTTVKGLRYFLDYASVHNSKLLYFSSSEIYGNPDINNIPTKESYKGHVSCVGPRACYDESKRLGETLLKIYSEEKNVHGVTVRPFNVFGPGMSPYDYRIVPNFFSQALNNKPISIYGNGEQTRTFCYISDAIEGFFKALFYGRKGEPYNIGNPDQEISIKDFSTLFSKVTDDLTNNFIITDYPDSYPADEPLRRCPDITKAREHFEFYPKISLENGLQNFYNWCKPYYS